MGGRGRGMMMRIQERGVWGENLKEKKKGEGKGGF